MSGIRSLALSIALMSSAGAASAQALDTNIIDDLSATEQSQLFGGAVVTRTNPVEPGTNVWEVTYYSVIKGDAPRVTAFNSTAVYQDLEGQPDYMDGLLLDYLVQAGADSAAILGLTATGNPEQPTLTHQINTVVRVADPGNPERPLYSTSYHVTDLPTPASNFLAQFGNVDFQETTGPSGKSATVMRYHAVLVPAHGIAENAAIKEQLVLLGHAVAIKHRDRMHAGATLVQRQRLHRMLHDD